MSSMTISCYLYESDRAIIRTSQTQNKNNSELAIDLFVSRIQYKEFCHFIMCVTVLFIYTHIHT